MNYQDVIEVMWRLYWCERVPQSKIARAWGLSPGAISQRIREYMAQNPDCKAMPRHTDGRGAA